MTTRAAHDARVAGQHLEVLGRPLVDDGEPLLEVVDEDVGRLVAQRGLDPLAVPGRRDLPGELGVDRVEQLRARCHEQARGVGVVLGLRDQVGRDEDAGRRVSSARMPISVGPASAVDADDALEQPLGRRDVDVARSGHQVGRLAVLGAVGEHRDRLRAADRVHLVDAEQRAGREDHRVRAGRRWSCCGGLATASEPTPATWAGTTFMTTLDG